jgi:hypothetical protein
LVLLGATSGKTRAQRLAQGRIRDFEIREELERELERRLTGTNIYARPALKDFEPAADEDQLSLIRWRES